MMAGVTFKPHEACHPCQRNGDDVDAVKWCTECSEALCPSCHVSHKSMKALMNHRIIDIEVANSSAAPDVIRTSLEFCKKHPNLKMEYHCQFHDSVCCHACMSQLHRACSNVIPIEVAARGTKQSKHIDELLSQLGSIEKNLDVVRQKKIENIKQIEEQNKSVRARALQLRQKVNNRLDLIEKNLNEELNDLTKAGKSKLERTERKIQQSQKMVRQHKEQIEFERKHGTDKQTFVLANVVKEHLIGIEEKIFRLKNHSEAISIDFQENNDILGNITSYGTVSFTKGPKPTVENEQNSISEESERFIQSFDFSLQFDATTHKDAVITGMAVTDDNRLLLCGGGKCNIIVCTFEGKHLQECKTAGEPWDIAITRSHEGKAVTTLPYLYAIQFINTNNMAAGKMVKFEWRVYGIASIYHQIIVGGKNCLHILNLDGIKLSEVVVPSMNVYYIHPRENGNFYYSDCSYVYCMKPDGRHAFCQDVSTLESPRNIVTDNRGNLLIAGHRSDSVHRLSSDGIAVDVPLSKKHGLSGPFAICFSVDKTKLFVSNNNGKTVLVYNSIYADISKETELQDLLKYL